MIKRYSILISFTLISGFIFSQKVGVVLSGGGASGISHVGFLKALEENNIPIDYIAGNSMGALVGGLYAAGYSPDEMEVIFTSEEFKNMATGKLEEKYRYFFKQQDLSASWVTIKLSGDTILQTSLPTSVISPVALDFAMMEMFSTQAAAANYKFDSLFVPFRCVASDIEQKELVIFRNGHLSQAIRASMSYPFYLKPITVNGKLLFDGGLYNNFPADVLYDEFFPDIIIGNNVSGNFEPPDEDNLISQIKNMLVSKTSYTTPCENGICIEPDIDVSTFAFDNAEYVIQKGYEETINRMEEIKTSIDSRLSKNDLDDKRKEYREKLPKLQFSAMDINGLKRNQEKYVRSILTRKKDSITTIEKIKPRYFKVFGDDKIRSIYPTAIQKNNAAFLLDLKVKKEKDIFLDFGGNFSNRPINQAYLGIQYNYLGNIGASIRGNFYFGKLYGSAQGKARLDFPVALPFYVEGHYTINRWDYFKSKAEFFEPATTSFLVHNENFYGGEIAFPIKNKGKMAVGLSAGQQKFSYYQTDLFTVTDTPDVSTFNFSSPYIRYERSTLNYKQYANSGTYLSFSASAVEGEEFNQPGSTSELDRTFSKLHEFLQFKFKYENYYKKKGSLRLGFLLEGVYSTQEHFNNYTASVLRAPSFQPTPESKTLFLESFRAYQYAALGHRVIINVKKSFDLRLAGYIFQPYQEIQREATDLTAKLGGPFDKRYTIANATLVYHSPLGPAAIGLNYYHNVPGIAPTERTPLTVLFHFGYVIFNNKALD